MPLQKKKKKKKKKTKKKKKKKKKAPSKMFGRVPIMRIFFLFLKNFFYAKAKKIKNIELCSTSYILDLNRGNAKVKSINQEKILQ